MRQSSQLDQHWSILPVPEIHGKMAASRVFQLDATQLQDELVDTFVRQSAECCKYCFTEGFSRFKPELKAVIQFFLLHQSLLSDRATFPQSMLGLKFDYDGKKKALIFIGLYVGCRWYSERTDVVNGLVSSLTGINYWAANKVSSLLEAILKIFSLVNFILFLLRGRYPTILDRVFNMRMVPSRPHTVQQPAAQYTNSEILWHGFTEFVMCVLPFVNVTFIKNWSKHTLMHYFPKLKTALIDPKMGVSLCGVCGDTPTMPHLGSCGHVFCYYCISANKMADKNFKCNTCSEVVLNYKPLERST